MSWRSSCNRPPRKCWTWRRNRRTPSTSTASTNPGRQPVSQGSANGRDHNPKGFCYFMAGGGIKGGTSYGETDPLGHEAVVSRRHIRDLHATILHLMGLDHEQLTYFYGGLDHKLTG